ncbi:MAG: terpene synthase family protein [Cystobacter sp.]
MSSAKESTLQSKYLQGLPDQGAQVFALTGELSAALRPWMDKHQRMVALTHAPEKIMRGARARQLCLTLAAAAPFLEVRELLPATCMGTWMFVVDELTDEHALISSPLWDGLCRFPALFDAPPSAELLAEPTLGPLAEALGDIQEQLRGRSLFAAVRPELALSVGDVLKGMAAEELWSTRYQDPSRPPLPGLEEYLEQGALQTTGVFPVIVSLLGALEDDSIERHLPRLLEMGRQAAICVRLANDLRTYEKELAQGKLNALGLVQREGMAREGLGEAEALERARLGVQARLDAAVARCMSLGAPENAERTTTRHAERFISNLVAFVCDFYTHHDYHHVLVRQDGNDIDAGTSAKS